MYTHEYVYHLFNCKAPNPTINHQHSLYKGAPVLGEITSALTLPSQLNTNLC